MPNITILVVEDELIVALDIQRKLRLMGYRTTTAAASGEEALRRIGEHLPDLILMDIKISGDMDGIETARAIRSRYDVPVIYLTAHADEATLERAKTTSPFGYIVKPFELRDLRTTIDMAMYRHEMEQKLAQSEARYRVISELVSDFAYSARVGEDGSLDWEWVTDAITEISGFSSDEISAQGGWTSLIHSGDMAVVSSLIQSLTDNRPVVAEFRLLTKYGGYRWLHNHARPVWDEQANRVTHVLGAASDVTERKEAEERIRHGAATAQALAELSRLVAEAGLHQQVVLDMAAQQTARLVGDACVITLVSDDGERLQPVAYFHRRGLLQPGTQPGATSSPLRPEDRAYQVLKTGQPAILETSARELAESDSLLIVPLRAEGQVIGTLGVSRDERSQPYGSDDQRLLQDIADRVAVAVSHARLYEALQHELAERRRVEERLAYLGTHDALTGLYNRANFDEQMARLESNRHGPVSVIVMDLDGLKVTNDSQGHAAGDLLLREAAAIVRDAFGADSQVARIGGDEFAVWLPAASEPDGQATVAHIRNRLAEHNATNPAMPISLSLGVATALPRDSLLVALALADAAMYQDKLARRATTRSAGDPRTGFAPQRPSDVRRIGDERG